MAASTITAEMETTDRDDSPKARALLRRIEQKPEASQRTVNDGSEVIAVDGKLAFLRQIYGARIEIARRNTPHRERAAAIKALRLELKAAIRAVTERRREERAVRREAARLRRHYLEQTI